MKTKYKYLLLVAVTILASILIYNYIEENKQVTVDPDILLTQNDIETKILDDMNYSIDNPKVILNPYKISPLTALIIFKTNDLASATITVKGKDGGEDITTTFVPAKNHIITVYGLYPDYENTVIINSSDEEKEIKIKTGKLPDEIKAAESYDGEGNNFYFTTSNDRNGYPIAYDKDGNVRWYLTKHYGADFTRLSNGYVLLGNSELMKDPYYSSGLVEMDLLGKIYFEYNIPGGYYKDVFEKTDGNLIALTNDFKSDTVEDVIVELDRSTGEIIKSFDLSKLIKNNKGNWIGLNSIIYDPNTNSIITVGNKKDMIISIDYTTGEINWIIADKAKIDSKYHKYLLTVEGEAMFPVQPEAITMTGSNIAFITTNGGNNHLIEYSINSIDKTFNEVNNINLGSTKGHTNLDFTNNSFIVIQGDTIKKIQNNESLKIIETDSDIYSAKETYMYAGDMYVPGRGVRIGETGITPTTNDYPIFLCKRDKNVFKQYNLELSSNPNRLIVKGTFKQSDKVQIILDNVLSKKTYNVNIKDGNKTSDGKIESTTYINKQGIYGKYYIYININNNIYKLNKYVMMS